MKQITKVVQEIGNGGHIYLPKETVGKKVVITLKEKTIGDIEEEIINILKPDLKHIQGIYLHGSYARNEQTTESDIDVLVLTDGKIKIKKRINEYEIISMSPVQLKKTLGYTAPLVLPAIREAIPILNQQLIQKYKQEKLTKKNTKWYIETTESSLKLAKYLVEEKDIGGVVYPLIMRLRGLHMISSLINNKQYSEKEIRSYLIKKGIPLDKIRQLNRMYREIRDKKPVSDNLLSYEDISKLYSAVYEYFQIVKSLWEKLK